MIEAAEQWFESRPSIRSLSQLIFNACPGMIPFNMSIYAMLGVSLFNLCHCISVVILMWNDIFELKLFDWDGSLQERISV